VTAGGSISGNKNGASFVAGQGSAYQGGLVNSVAAQASSLSTDANALASALAGLGATGTAAVTNGGNTLLITAADPNHLGYSVVDVPITLLVNNPNAAISFANPNDLTVFIDVTGLAANQSYTIQNNSNDTSQDQLAVWNFGTTAATLHLNNQVVGSLLAPDATIVQSGAAKINGSVVAQDFTQGAEVHLGTFNGVNPFTPGVPEPATWAMLILGMGMIGATARRRREAGALAA
jgi:choice-of-anchor A domain-containing protein